MSAIVEAIEDELRPVIVLPVPLARDCVDGVFAVYWGRPELYLDGDVLRNILNFALAADDQLADGLARLASPRWQPRFAPERLLVPVITPFDEAGRADEWSLERLRDAPAVRAGKGGDGEIERAQRDARHVSRCNIRRRCRPKPLAPGGNVAKSSFSAKQSGLRDDCGGGGPAFFSGGQCCRVSGHCRR